MKVNVMSFPFQHWFCSLIISHEYAVLTLVLDMKWLFGNSVYFQYNIFGLVLQHHRKAHIEIKVTNSKVKVIMTHEEPVIYSAIATNLLSV